MSGTSDDILGDGFVGFTGVDGCSTTGTATGSCADGRDTIVSLLYDVAPGDNGLVR
jgi:hypothetical protein